MGRKKKEEGLVEEKTAESEEPIEAEEPKETDEVEEQAEETTEEAEEQTEAPQQSDRQMWKIKCSECGKDGEVPFQPSGDRPVYCRDCFMKRRRPRRDFGYRRF